MKETLNNYKRERNCFMRKNGGNYKKIITLILSVLMLLSSVTSALGSEFSYEDENKVVFTEPPEGLFGDEEIIVEDGTASQSVEAQEDEILYTESESLENQGGGLIDWSDPLSIDDVLWKNSSDAFSDCLPAQADSDETDEDTQALLEAVVSLRDAMVKRKTSVSLTLELSQKLETDEIKELGKLLLQLAVEDTVQPDEGDYLNYHLRKVVWNTFWGGGSTYNLAYTIEYYTSAEQEQKVAAKINEILENMAFTDATTSYMKIRTIYSYIVENVVYDYDNLKDDSYTLKYSAYAALMNGKAVCQGYATLLYRMLKTSGIDCRVIRGIGNGGPHVWNIIYLKGKYYNTDSTWDACYLGSGQEYCCFMKSNYDFADHFRDTEFNTAEFNAHYPMAEISYKMQEEDWQEGECTHEWSNWEVINSATCLEEGCKGRICRHCGAEEIQKISVTAHKWKYVAKGNNTHESTCSICKASSVKKCSFSKNVCKYCKGIRVPVQVKFLKIKAAASNNLRLSWTSVTGATGYQIYRLVGKKWYRIATTTKNYYVHTSSKKYPIKPGISYSYKVRAICKTASKTTAGKFSSVVSGKTK